jgi:hypothetical protein
MVENMDKEELLKYIEREIKTARAEFYGHECIDDESLDTGYWSGYLSAMNTLRAKILTQSNDAE